MRNKKTRKSQVQNAAKKMPLKRRVQIYFANNPKNRKHIYTDNMKIGKNGNVAM